MIFLFNMKPYTINMYGIATIYEQYRETVIAHSEIGIAWNSKIKLREFNSKLFERAMLNLTEKTIQEIIEDIKNENRN